MIRICRFVVGEKTREAKEGKGREEKGKGRMRETKKKVCEGNQSKDAHKHTYT
jgi:hypothetical protein